MAIITTCIHCGAKGAIDGTEGEIQLTILCDECQKDGRAVAQGTYFCPLCGWSGTNYEEASMSGPVCPRCGRKGVLQPV